MVFLKNDEVCAVANREGTKFFMDFQGVPKVACAAVNLKEWHERLAHQNMNQVISVLKDCKGDVVNENPETCKPCLEGKQHRRSFPRSESKTSYVGELIHADLSGKSEEESIGGSNYFLLLKDDYSKLRTVYFFKHKSETHAKLGHFLKLCETITGNKVKTVRTDQGSEFKNKENSALFEREGIIHETSDTYMPQQNGKIEREMRTVGEAARTMLKAAKVKESLWAEAVNTAV